jgi:hypothetical protein
MTSALINGCVTWLVMRTWSVTQPSLAVGSHTKVKWDHTRNILTVGCKVRFKVAKVNSIPLAYSIIPANFTQLAPNFLTKSYHFHHLILKSYQIHSIQRLQHDGTI